MLSTGRQTKGFFLFFGHSLGALLRFKLREFNGALWKRRKTTIRGRPFCKPSRAIASIAPAKLNREYSPQ
jgi:hypothetical protein